jgi:hypothetical protein
MGRTWHRVLGGRMSRRIAPRVRCGRFGSAASGQALMPLSVRKAQSVKADWSPASSYTEVSR